MKKHLTYAFMIWFADITMSSGGDKDTVTANEKAAWQAYKDRDEAAFKKVVDKDIKCIYPDGIQDMAKELEDMKQWDIKSVTVSDYSTFSDEKDVIVSTYKVKVDGTYRGKDMTGDYNAGTVWKKEGKDWLAIFHTNIKAEGAGQ
jgi:hypothetical protein